MILQIRRRDLGLDIVLLTKANFKNRQSGTACGEFDALPYSLLFTVFEAVLKRFQRFNPR